MPRLLLDILNYGLRAAIIIIGILFVGGWAMPVPGAEEFTVWMGWTFIAFGTYRLILYFIRSRQETEPENDEQN